VDNTPKSEFLSAALDAAKAAAEISRSYYAGNFTVTTKSDMTPVTEADVECEQAIRNIILERFPTHGFYGEETGRSQDDAEYLWLVDPIDGTANYLRGLRHWGVCIAYVSGGQVQIGIVHDSPTDRLYHARLGHGAIRAMAEHKGSGLSLMCELLAGALTGSGCAGPGKAQVFNGMLSIYLDTAAFDSDGYFAREVRRYLDFFQSAKPAEAGGEVLLPGDVERRNRTARLAHGIPLTDGAWRALVETARAVGVAEQDIAAPRA